MFNVQHETEMLQINPYLIPTTLDMAHLTLLGLVILLLILQVMLLSFMLMGLLRRKPETTPTQRPVQEPAPRPAEPARTPPPVRVAEPVRKETVVVREATPDAALQLLGLMQKEARFLDFVSENIGSYSDADIGAAARVVHDGCRKVIHDHVLEPVRSEPEGNRLTLPKGYDAASIRVSGNIVGEAPFTGTLIHRGWKATETRLPKIAEGHNVSIIAQAEVEL